MIKTHYICDKCGRSQENSSEQMWEIRVQIRHMPQTSHHFEPSFGNVIQELWCRTCIEAIGALGKQAITIRVEPDEEQELAPPTLEEMIRALVKDAFQEAYLEHQ